MNTKQLTPKELKLMEEYAGTEAQNTDAVGDWYTATYHENVLRLIAAYRALMVRTTVTVNSVLRQDAD